MDNILLVDIGTIYNLSYLMWYNMYSKKVKIVNIPISFCIITLPVSYYLHYVFLYNHALSLLKVKLIIFSTVDLNQIPMKYANVCEGFA